MFNRLTDDELKAMLENTTNNMLKGYCPMNQGNCTKKCMHFMEGYIIYNPTTGNSDLTPSKCKLW